MGDKVAFFERKVLYFADAIYISGLSYDVSASYPRDVNMIVLYSLVSCCQVSSSAFQIPETV